MKIKICGMKYVRNLQQVGDLEPDYLGFIFYPGSPRYMVGRLQPSDLSELSLAIKKVGVFVNEPIENLIKLVKSYKLDVVQLHGNEPPLYCKYLHEKGQEIWKAVGMDNSCDFHSLESYAGLCSHFLFDKKTILHGGSGKKFNWQILNHYTMETPFILSGGLGPGDIDLIDSISHNKLVGVDLNSGFETKPGIKDVKLLRNFMNIIRQKK